MDILASTGIVSGLTLRNKLDLFILESKFLNHPGVEKQKYFL